MVVFALRSGPRPQRQIACGSCFSDNYSRRVCVDRFVPRRRQRGIYRQILVDLRGSRNHRRFKYRYQRLYILRIEESSVFLGVHSWYVRGCTRRGQNPTSTSLPRLGWRSRSRSIPTERNVSVLLFCRQSVPEGTFTVAWSTQKSNWAPFTALNTASLLFQRFFTDQGQRQAWGTTAVDYMVYLRWDKCTGASFVLCGGFPRCEIKRSCEQETNGSRPNYTTIYILVWSTMVTAVFFLLNRGRSRFDTARTPVPTGHL